MTQVTARNSTVQSGTQGSLHLQYTAQTSLGKIWYTLSLPAYAIIETHCKYFYKQY
jgi:hypothetical protein